MSIVSISMLAVCVSVLIVCVRSYNGEIAHIMTIGAAIIIFLSLVPHITDAIEQVKYFAAFANMGSKYLAPMLKITGIAYVSTLGAQLCSDAGLSTLSTKVEMAGKIAVCVATLPIAREAFERIAGIIG